MLVKSRRKVAESVQYNLAFPRTKETSRGCWVNVRPNLTFFEILIQMDLTFVQQFVQRMLVKSQNSLNSLQEEHVIAKHRCSTLDKWAAGNC